MRLHSVFIPLYLAVGSLAGGFTTGFADERLTPSRPHPDAIANSHAPGEVDRPELVPFIEDHPQHLAGIVVDEIDAVLNGSWQYSTHTPPYVGIGYLHDQKTGKGNSSVTFTPDLPAAGRYEVRLSHCYNVRRSTNTPVTIHSADGDKTVRINQQEVPKHGRLFRSLGTFLFNRGRDGYVRIDTHGTDGKYVIADAVQFIPEPKPVPAQRAKQIGSCEGFSLPETVLHDPLRDVYFVSCMVGNPTAMDNNGEIRLIEPDKLTISRPFIRGGLDGNTLHGPKGMVVVGKTLWVADIDTIRGFDTTTGRPTTTVELKSHGAIAINDLAIGPDGTIYACDPRLVFGDNGKSTHQGVDRIFAVSKATELRTVLMSNKLAQPNGLAWDLRNDRLLVAPLESKNILSIDPRDGAMDIAAVSSGRFDGLEVLTDGQIIVSCLGEGTVRNVSDASLEPLVRNRRFPGNIGIDHKRNRLLVPLIADGRVETWKLESKSKTGNSQQ